MNAEERRIYRFAGFSLDAAGGLLRNGSGEIALRPKSFDLLTYLVRNAGRVVSKSELMDAVWPNVTVTEDSLTRCIFDIRRALDDSGQMLVRTISRRGYLFSAEMLDCGDVVTMSMPTPEIASGESAAIVHRGSGVAAEPSEDGMPDEARHGRRMLQALVVESLSDSPVAAAQTGRFGSAEWVADHELRIRPTRSSGRARAAIAILPFSANAGAGEDCRPSMTADGLVYDVIRSLSRLRSIFVIAANSTKVLRNRGLEPRDAGRLLKVDYICSGRVSTVASDVRLDAELLTVADGRVLWSDGWNFSAADATSAGGTIAGELTRAIATHIDLNERHLALRKQARELDAWEAYHRGLWHMYRFTQADNAAAQHLFGLSIRLDPSFSLPYAGLSFTHWMNAFMLAPDARNDEAGLAFNAAAQGVATDPLDPAVQAALGRALWINGSSEEALAALETSVRLSPNFAFGHYAMGFVQSFSGDPENGIAAIDHARALSPFDPFLCAMHGARAAALLRLGRTEEAAAWGARAARQPNAHAHIQRVGAICMASAGKTDEARALSRHISARSPDNGGEHFIRAWRLSRFDESLFRSLARLCDLD